MCRSAKLVVVLLAGVLLVPGGAQGQGQPDNRSGTDAAVAVQNDAAKTSETTSAKAADTPTPEPAFAVRLGAGDLVSITVYGVPEMSADGRVNANGELTVALIGPVQVSGLTSAEAERLISKKLRDAGMLRDPYVTLFVKEYATQGISVLGEVQRPGIYPLLGARRLYDAISSAGGTTPRAGRIVNITRRNDPDHPILVSMDTDPARSAAGNVEIYPGDTVVVSKAGVIYVVGDVARPGGFVMDNNEKLRTLQAVALAQGFNHTASLDGAKLIRKTPEGMKEFPVPMKKIMESKVADLEMQNDDILFIPTSAAKGAFRRGMEAAIQAATGVAIYRR
ncbi:MAG: polysaccharide biosynthesis/export family protein [Acidobacteriales bacterium]|nr:polysaccharide biosynthesis/export family protein [Terriglobales bacterium]